jgi:methylmalonyl-CoA mutase C-terminal domain/subunit
MAAIGRGSGGNERCDVTAFTVWEHRVMAAERIVVGASGDDAAARLVARRLRDAGHEVVFAGGHQTAEHLVRAAVAEDATRLVVDADDAGVDRVRELCSSLDAEDIVVVRRCDAVDAT